MVTVKFARTFTRGTLKGLTIPQTLGGFPTAKHADRWIQGCARYAERNGYVDTFVEIVEN